MRAAIRIGLLASWVATAGALAGCAQSVLVIRDVTLRGDAWSMVVDRMTDGPDGFVTSGFGATRYYPEKGERFFWVRVKVRNDAPVARQFNFDRCDLDLADRGIVPGVVATAPVTFKADRVETVAAGDSIDRYLIFSYPLAATPTRLSCAPMVARLPAIALR
jgi:hypothetical protein